MKSTLISLLQQQHPSPPPRAVCPSLHRGCGPARDSAPRTTRHHAHRRQPPTRACHVITGLQQARTRSPRHPTQQPTECPRLATHRKAPHPIAHHEVPPPRAGERAPQKREGEGGQGALSPHQSGHPAPNSPSPPPPPLPPPPPPPHPAAAAPPPPRPPRPSPPHGATPPPPTSTTTQLWHPPPLPRRGGAAAAAARRPPLARPATVRAMAGSHSGWARAGQAGRVRSGRSPELDGYGAGDGYISNDGPAPLPGSAATRRTYTRGGSSDVAPAGATGDRNGRRGSQPTTGITRRRSNDDGARRCTNGRDGDGRGDRNSWDMGNNSGEWKNLAIWGRKIGRNSVDKKKGHGDWISGAGKENRNSEDMETVLGTGGYIFIV
ncbi:hypothetical protein BJ912DRAFT_1050543 [Pholiota molesta]|nr:hypothetical protein BJ912DRAFT_1050543 [Pholiota molesta]